MIPCNGKKVNRGFINSISGDWKIFMEKDKNGQIFGDGCRDTSRRQLKSFSVQQFFKNAAEVWASSPHLRSKSKLHYEIKQKSKRKSEESQLPSKSEGCNESQGFRGNCDSQGVPQPCRTGCNWFPKCNVSHETLQKLLLGKTIFSVRQKGVPPLLLPASVLQLPRCPV